MSAVKPYRRQLFSGYVEHHEGWIAIAALAALVVALVVLAVIAGVPMLEDLGLVP